MKHFAFLACLFLLSGCQQQIVCSIKGSETFRSPVNMGIVKTTRGYTGSYGDWSYTTKPGEFCQRVFL